MTVLSEVQTKHPFCGNWFYVKCVFLEGRRFPLTDMKIYPYLFNKNYYNNFEYMYVLSGEYIILFIGWNNSIKYFLLWWKPRKEGKGHFHFIYLFIFLFIFYFLFFYLFIYLFIYLFFIYLFIHLFWQQQENQRQIIKGQTIELFGREMFLSPAWHIYSHETQIRFYICWTWEISTFPAEPVVNIYLILFNLAIEHVFQTPPPPKNTHTKKHPKIKIFKYKPVVSHVDFHPLHGDGRKLLKRNL